MANLPDLVTTDIGIIAFWNAKDHWTGPGANTIDPTNCAGVFDSYSVYDNGIEGHKALGSGRYFHARVKSDGWMVAWIDRTNTFAYPNKVAADFGETGHRGYYDILYDWFAAALISSTYTTTSHLISLLYNALTNKGDFAFAAADVGHYCYEYSEANVLTLCAVFNKTGNVQYTTGTIMYYAAATGRAVTDNAAHSCKFAGNTLMSGPTGGVAKFGVGDIVAEGWMPNPLTNYPLSASGGVSYAALLIIWK